MPRFPILVVVLAAACRLATAQTAATPAQDVQRLAPQLVTFAGSPANFQSLVSGLAAGSPVQLTTPLSTGLNQLVTFTPGGALTVQQIVQTLEGVRQQLIGLGIGNPS